MMAGQLKEILQPLNTSGKPKKIKIGQTYPHSVSRQYTSDLRKIVKAMTQEINRDLMPIIKRDIQSKNGNKRQDSLSEVMAKIRQMLDRLIPGALLAERYATETYQANERNISNSIKRSLGIEINLPVGELDMMEDWVSTNVMYIQDLQEEYLKRIQKSVVNGYTKNKKYSEIAEEIQKATGITWRRASTIAQDQIGTLNGLITKERNKELGIEKARWRTLSDERVRGDPSGFYPNARPSHYAREGVEFDWDKGIDGEVPGSPIQCFPFESKLNHTPLAEVLYRRWYTGELTEIVSDDGVICRVTPNHPILTTKGFKAAKLINSGDNIIKTIDNVPDIVELYGKDFVPVIGDVFESFRREGIRCGVTPSSGGEFHGDISDGDIDTIRTDSFLWNGINAGIIEKFYKLGFSRSDMMLCRLFLSSFGSVDSDIPSMLNSRRSLVTRLNLIFSSFVVHLRPLELFSFASGSWTYSSEKEMSSDYSSCNSKVFRDCIFAFSVMVHGSDIIKRKIDLIMNSSSNKLGKINSNTLGSFKEFRVFNSDTASSLSDSGTVKYKVSKVVKVNRVSFSGHVYNLQTVSGDYTCQTTAVSNCRCFAESVIELD